jgi:hypothetical protein
MLDSAVGGGEVDEPPKTHMDQDKQTDTPSDSLSGRRAEKRARTGGMADSSDSEMRS